MDGGGAEDPEANPTARGSVCGGTGLGVLLRSQCFFLFSFPNSVAVAHDGHGRAVVKQAIENRRGDGRVSKNHASFAQRTITRYQYGLGFVHSADKLEEQMRDISTPCGFDRGSPQVSHMRFPSYPSDLRDDFPFRYGVD